MYSISRLPEHNVYLMEKSIRGRRQSLQKHENIFYLSHILYTKLFFSNISGYSIKEGLTQDKGNIVCMVCPVFPFSKLRIWKRRVWKVLPFFFPFSKLRIGKRRIWKSPVFFPLLKAKEKNRKKSLNHSLFGYSFS